jgi:hypothetical protein
MWPGQYRHDFLSSSVSIGAAIVSRFVAEDEPSRSETRPIPEDSM